MHSTPIPIWHQFIFKVFLVGIFIFLIWIKVLRRTSEAQDVWAWLQLQADTDWLHHLPEVDKGQLDHDHLDSEIADQKQKQKRSEVSLGNQNVFF